MLFRDGTHFGNLICGSSVKVLVRVETLLSFLRIMYFK